MTTTGLRLPRKRAWSTGTVLGLLSSALTVAAAPATAGVEEAGGPAWKLTSVPVPGAILADVAGDRTTWTVGYSWDSVGYGFKPTASQRTRGTWSPNRATGLPARGRLDGVDTVGLHTWAVGTEEIPGPEAGTVSGFRALAARWNGTTWKSAPLPLPRADTVFSQLQAIDVLPDGRAWAVGSETDRATGTEHGLVLHYDGERWKRMAAPKGSSFISGVTVINDSSVWLTDNGYDGHWRSRIHHWNGARWAQRFSSAPGTDVSLEAVTGRSDRNVWAVGYTETGGNDTSKSVALHFDGRTWTRITTPQQDNARLLDVATTANDRAVAVGYTPGERFYALTLTPGGARHTPTPAQSADTPGGLHSVSASRTGLWIVGAVRTGEEHDPVAARAKSLPH